MHQSTHIKWIISPCLLIIALLFAGIHAFPFSKSSGVQELTPAQLKTVLQTHKPVFLLLYAPWCGHCKALHPEYERFAKKTRGVIDVVAIDCDKHNSVGSQYNLKGFPTVIYYGTKKGLKDWKPYQGARNAAGMTGVALSLVESHHVRMVSTENLLHKALQASAQSPVRRVLALFTEKEKAPPLVQVLAYDPALKNTVPVVVFRKSSAGQLLEKFTPPSFPALAILDQHPETLEVVVQSWFEGEITYDAILSYVSRTASLPKSGETSAAKEHESKTNKAAKPGFPARLIEFNVGQMSLFCVPTAPQKKQQQPYCVVAVYEVNEDDIYGTVSQNLFHQFRNDPLVIMYTHNAELLHSLGVLSIDAPLPALAVFREGSRGVRFVTRSFVDSKDLEVRGRSFLEQLLGGEVAMTKGPNTFPKTA